MNNTTATLPAKRTFNYNGMKLMIPIRRCLRKSSGVPRTPARRTHQCRTQRACHRS
ncbi:MAG: hypothetical protein L6W00_20505 [Lentisphaeria bacterium]|nr:MAG: hypothetical protein L6W00_20505 [Lentisphaeria bacterium]